MSQHVGDMGSVETLSAFSRSTRQFAEMYEVDAALLATDAHPGYQTRRWAEAEAEDTRPGGARPVALVQHHHAHVAAAMAEHGVPAGERVIGVVFDGTGYGTDGAIWGGEVLVAGYDAFERSAHLGYVSLPGGDATIRKPYRAALAHLAAAGIEWRADLPPVQAAAQGELGVIQRQLERGIECVPTSSMGRLFDAISSLLGVRHVASYEGQAAIELETVASSYLAETGQRAGRRYRFAMLGDQIDIAPVLLALVDDLRSGHPTGAVAASFHDAVAHLIGEVADRLRGETGIDRVVLSGGVFQNVLLVGLARAELAKRDLRVLTHHVVPPNDGGLALGQAAIAGYRALAGTAPSGTSPSGASPSGTSPSGSEA